MAGSRAKEDLTKLGFVGGHHRLPYVLNDRFPRPTRGVGPTLGPQVRTQIS